MKLSMIAIIIKAKVCVVVVFIMHIPQSISLDEQQIKEFFLWLAESSFLFSAS